LGWGRGSCFGGGFGVGSGASGCTSDVASCDCGGASAGIEPVPANIYTHKTLSGSFAVKNAYLEALLDKKGKNTPAVWENILAHEGSVQQLDFLDQHEKDVFKTAFEIDQRWIIELAADRAPLVCQSQSLNIFLAGDVDKWDLHMLHWMAWEQGVKSLYYCRSKSVQRAGFAQGEELRGPVVEPVVKERTDYEECLACQ
jgi:ribonucleoside-diphosphate reductase alpha chain